MKSANTQRMATLILVFTVTLLSSCSSPDAPSSETASRSESSPATGSDPANSPDTISLGDTSVHWMVSEPGSTIATTDSSALIEASDEEMRVFDLLNGVPRTWAPASRPTSAAGLEGDFIWVIDLQSEQQGLEGGDVSTHLQRVDGVTGEVRWDIDIGEKQTDISPGVVVLSSPDDDALTGINPADGSTAWNQKKGPNYVSSTGKGFCEEPLPLLVGTGFPEYVEPIDPATGAIGPKLFTSETMLNEAFVCRTASGYITPSKTGHTVFDERGQVVSKIKGTWDEGYGVEHIGLDYLLVTLGDYQGISRTNTSGQDPSWTLPSDAKLRSVNGDTALFVRADQLVSVDIKTGEQTGFVSIAQLSMDQPWGARPIKNGFRVQGSSPSGSGMWLGVFDNRLPLPPDPNLPVGEGQAD